MNLRELNVPAKEAREHLVRLRQGLDIGLARIRENRAA